MTLLATLLQLSGLLGFTWWLLAQYRDPHVSSPVLAAVFLSWVLGFLSLLLLPLDLAQNGFVAVADAITDAAVTTVETLTAVGNVTTSTATAAADTVGMPTTAAPTAAATTMPMTAIEDRAQLLWVWQALYWLTFTLSWIALPFLAEFCQNGEFVLEHRVASSLRRLMFHWTILASVGAAAVAYLIFVGNFTTVGLVGLAMASSNTYGLLWLISLLGYGLVEIPRCFWTLRLPANRLKALFFRAVQVHDERVEAIFELEDVIDAVHDCYERMLQAEGVAIILTTDMQFVKTCLLQVKELVSRDSSSRRLQRVSAVHSASAASWTSAHPRDRRSTSRRATTATDSPFTSSMRTPTLSEVVDLHRRVKLALTERRRSEQAWVELCIEAEVLQDRVARRELPPASLFPATSLLNNTRNAVIRAQNELRRRAVEPISIVCAGVAAAASLCIVWSETTMGLPSASLSLFHAFTRAWGTNASELLAFTTLLYMVVCSYSSLLTLRAFGKFALRPRQGSTERCLLQTSMHQCRLQFALGYNFLLLLNDHAVTDRTAFSALWQHMRIVHVFGRGFAVYAPLLLVLLVVFTLSDGYAHVMKRVGVEQYEQVLLGSAEHEVQITKGEVLVQQGLERYKAVVRRRKHGTALSSYGFAKTSAGAQALLDDDDSAASDDSSEQDDIDCRVVAV